MAEKRFRIDDSKASYKRLAEVLRQYNGAKISAESFNGATQEERIKGLRKMSGRVFGLGNRNINCISRDHDDATPSMGFCEQTGGFHCFGCGCSCDIFDIVGAVYCCKSFSEKYRKTVKLLVEDGADTAFHPKFTHFGKRGGNSENSINSRAYSEKNRKSGIEVSKAMQKPLHNPYYHRLSDTSFEHQAACLGYLQSRMLGLFLPIDMEQFAEKYYIRGWFYDCALYLVFINDDGTVCRRWIGGAHNYHTDVRWWNTSGNVGIFNERDLYKNDAVFVCEGIFDALTVLACGYNAVSVNGVNNLKKIRGIADIKPIILMDCDSSGRNAAQNINLNSTKGTEFFVPDFLLDECNGDSVLAQFDDVNDVVSYDKYNGNKVYRTDELRSELKRLYNEGKSFYAKRG